MMEEALRAQVAGMNEAMQQQMWTKAVADRFLTLRKEASMIDARAHAVQAVKEIDVLFQELQRARAGAPQPLPAGSQPVSPPQLDPNEVWRVAAAFAGPDNPLLYDEIVGVDRGENGLYRVLYRNGSKEFLATAHPEGDGYYRFESD